MNNSIFEKHKKELHKKKIIKKKADKDFYDRYLSIYHSSKFMSYLINLLSVATAMSFIYWAAKDAMPLWLLIAGMAVVGILFELAKRMTSDVFFDDYWKGNFNQIAFAGFLFFGGINVAGSYFGTYDSYINLSEPYQDEVIESNAEAVALIASIADLEKEKAKWEKVTWRGKIVEDSREYINKNISPVLDPQKTRLAEIRQNLSKKNLAGDTSHKSEKKNYAAIFGLVIFSLEIMFGCAMSFKNYFEERTKVEETNKTNTPVSKTTSKPVSKASRKPVSKPLASSDSQIPGQSKK